MSTIVTRSGKGSPLTHNEVDANFTNLNSDKTENSAAAITGGSINNTTIGNTTPNAATFTTLTATGQTSLGGAAGSESFRVVPTASAVNYWQATGAATTSFALLNATGSDTNVSGALVSKGTGALIFSTNGFSSNNQMRVTHTTNAVNYVQVTGGATANFPAITAQGSDTNVGLRLSSKGTQSIRFDNNNTANQLFRIDGSATASVNYFQVSGANTTFEPVFSAQGSDTNISMAFQSKGTGGISLSTGSTGTNLVNGTTVTAITRTAAGSGYTSIPSVVISAPTTAGGVQATATATMELAAVTQTVVNGGTGYTVNDVLTISGGTFGTAAQFVVTAVSGGVITAVVRGSIGVGYTALPTNPVSVTGGTGTGATFNASWGITNVFTITNAGSGYVEQPTVTFSGGGGSGAAAYATVGSGTTVRSLGSSVSFYTPNQQISFQVADYPGASSTGYWQTYGGLTSPELRAVGSVAGVIGTSSAVPVRFLTNSGSAGAEQLRVSHTASAVNYVQVTGAATGVGPTISSQGSDTNVDLLFGTRGRGAFVFRTSTSVRQFQINDVISAVNFLQVGGAVAGAAPAMSSAGSDTNIDLALTPKGTGLVRFGTYTASMALTVQGYIEIKDSGGTVRRLAVVA